MEHNHRFQGLGHGPLGGSGGQGHYPAHQSGDCKTLMI